MSATARRTRWVRSHGIVCTAATLLVSVAGIAPLEAPAAAAAGAPTNNHFAQASVLSGSDGMVTGTNAGAGKDPGEPDHADNVGGRSVWYRWSPPVTGRVTIGTAGSDFDTLLAVYTGDAVGSLTHLVSSDDATGAPGLQSSVGFTATAGTVYRIAVDGYASDGGRAATGTIVLRWSGVSAPASVRVTSPNGGETVAPATTIPIT